MAAGGDCFADCGHQETDEFNMTIEPDKLHLAKLELIERRFEKALRELREFRHELEGASKDKGVLGSRGLTEFVIAQLQQAPTLKPDDGGGWTITSLLHLAETAGYAVPTRRILSKRLTERAYRVGDIAFDSTGGFWYWKG
jgi:hypothetical protein